MFLWGMAKGFLHEDTVKKIHILDSDKVDPILEYTHPSQLEEKYGGTLPNLTEFWPIKTVSELPNLEYKV